MIDTVIVSGGMIQKDFALDFIRKIEEERKGKKLLLLAADRGLDFFLETGLVPDIVDGDFDSLSGAGKAYLESLDHTEIVRLNPEKDDTDTQSTLNLAIRRGAKNILILGATGGRLDHFIGNMGLLGYGRQKGVNVILADAQNYICLVENGDIIRKDSQFGKYVSFFAAGETVEGLTLKGFKYPLDHYRLTTDNCGRTVSNEIQEETGQDTLRKRQSSYDHVQRFEINDVLRKRNTSYSIGNMRCFFKFIRLSRAFVLMERVGYAKIKRCIEKTIWGRKYIIFLLFVV